MCNDYRLNVDLDTIAGDFSDLKIKIDFPEGAPNVQPRDDIKITDVGPIVRAGSAPGTAELVQRRWSWPGPSGKPVYNFRSEGREFGENRCLIITDGFYEFTAPVPVEGMPKKLNDKWLFTMRGRKWFCIAGIYRQHPVVGEAFTMLTIDPGPDVAPYHNRQVVVLPPEDWPRWLDATVSAADVIHAVPAGTLEVRQVG